MAEKQYEIVIRNETDETEKSPVANKTGDAKAESTQKEKIRARKANVANYLAVKRIVSPFVRQAVQYGISTVSVRTGRKEEQQRLQFAYSVGSQALGMLESIAVGAAVGGLAGAIGGAVMSVLTTATNYALNQQKINLNSQLEGVSIGLMNIRAGGDVAATAGSRR